MCGIAGYIGEKKASKILLTALRRLEYRGYDSVGIATINNNQILVKKGEGRVNEVDNKLHFEEMEGTMGISHTRWSTHGRPSDRNAHPFLDSNKQFAVVHNGIIENYLELKEELLKKGVKFTSDTDSEVIAHLISDFYQGDLLQAVLKTVNQLRGSFALCVLKNDASEIIGARNGSPLLVGLGEKENILASDASAIVEHTKNVIYLNDFEIAELTKEQVKIFDFSGKEKKPEIKKINWNLEQAQKQGYKHFMLKEIYEQPEVIRNSLGINFELEKNFSRIVMVACGTASYAGLVGKYLIEKMAKIPVDWEIASEFRYKECLVSKEDLVVVISQSGETADTLAALRLAKERGAKTLGIVNVVDSTIAREVDQVIYTRAGPEIGVASTKAFTSQLVALYKLAFYLGRGSFPLEIVQKVKQVLELNEQIKEIACHYYNSHSFLYLGRNLMYPLALEGALKLKEISYIHAEAYPAGELKHGPIALISNEMPTIALCPRDAVYEKTFSNLEEVRARNGKVITIATEGDEKIKKVSDEVVYVPRIEEEFYPFLMALVVQLFAYHIADFRECDIDKPRNLAKSVTVE